jgi:hypothetical protein
MKFFNGGSVIDYFAVTSGLTDKVDFLKVLKFNEFSDHRLLSLKFRCNSFSTINSRPLKDCYDHAPCRYLLNDQNIDSFAEMQNSETSKTQLEGIKNLILVLDANEASEGEAPED